MKTTTENEVTIKPLIQCRPDDGLGKAFFENCAKLGVTESELARRALRRGLEAAVKEILSEQMADTRNRMKRLKSVKGKMLDFNYPPQCFVNATELFA